MSLVRVPELLDTIRVPKGHELRDTNRVVSLVRVPGSCPLTFWHDFDDPGTRFRDTNRVVSLNRVPGSCP